MLMSYQTYAACHHIAIYLQMSVDNNLAFQKNIVFCEMNIAAVIGKDAELAGLYGSARCRTQGRHGDNIKNARDDYGMLGITLDWHHKNLASNLGRTRNSQTRCRNSRIGYPTALNSIRLNCHFDRM